jgi:putative transposase
MMLYRGIEVTYETIREWCQKFGQPYSNQLRRKRPFIPDKWHLDEVVVTIKKPQYYLWRAVDSEGNVLEPRTAPTISRLARSCLLANGCVKLSEPDD